MNGFMEGIDVNDLCELCGTPLMDRQVSSFGEVTVETHQMGSDECLEAQQGAEVQNEGEDEEEWREALSL